MRCKIYIADKYFKTINATPECGEDFCESCGDCLACHGGDPCYMREEGHWWVKEFDRKEDCERWIKEAGDEETL